MNTFSISESIRFGWETFKKRPWFFVGTFLLINVLAEFSFQGGGDQFGQITVEMVILFILLGIVLWVIQTFAKMGRIQFQLRAHDAPETVKFADLWAPHPFWKFFLTMLVYGLIILAGFILLIVPGIIWAIKYQFAPYIMMERKGGIMEAIHESGRITYGHKWQLFLFGLALLGINILGALALLVGLLVTIPVSLLATAHVYRTLEHKASEVAPVAPAAA